MDIGIGTGAVGGGLAPQLPAGGVEKGVQSSPGTTDVERLQAAMRQPEPEPAEAVQNTEQAGIKAASEKPASGEGSLGDRILDGMSSLSDKIQAGRAEAAAVIEKPEVSHNDLLKVNMALLETGTIVSAASKTVEKITQGVKTLQQG